MYTNNIIPFSATLFPSLPGEIVLIQANRFNEIFLKNNSFFFKNKLLQTQLQSV